MAVRAAALCVLLAHQASPALAQAAAPITLIVSEGHKEIGREEFTLTSGRGRGASGTTLAATAKYPATVPTTRLTALLERTPESAIAKFQLDVESASGTTVILAAGTGARLVVRTVAKGSESGRELPGGPDVVLLHHICLFARELCEQRGIPSASGALSPVAWFSRLDPVASSSRCDNRGNISSVSSARTA